MRTENDNIFDDDREFSPFDAEAEPDDLAAMEAALSETTEEGCCDMPPEQYDPLKADGIPQDGALCGNMPELMGERELMEEMDYMAELEEWERYALAEPEPPGEDAP